MIDHVSIGVSNIARAKRFYDRRSRAAWIQMPRQKPRLARLRFRQSVAVDSRRRSPSSGRYEIRAPLLLHRADACQRRWIPRRGACCGWSRQRRAGPKYYAAFATDPDGYRL